MKAIRYTHILTALFTTLVMLPEQLSDSFSDRWVQQSARPVYTIFYQGIFASQTQLAQYTPYIHTTTGHIVRASKKCAIDIVQHPFIGKEIEEVISASRMGPLDSAQSFVLGLLEKYRFGYSIKRINKQSVTDGSAFAIDFSTIDLAQERSIEQFHEKYTLWQAAHPGTDCILFGVSRGAATVFNALATHKYPARLVILESCFGSIPEIMQHAYGKQYKNILTLLARSTRFKVEGPSPLMLLDQFPPDIPVVFISSHKDQRVPYTSTRNLAYLLACKKQNPVYLITLKKSAHGQYSSSSKRDRAYYQAVMHAIYRAHNLPYIKEFADAGLPYLGNCLISDMV